MSHTTSKHKIKRILLKFLAFVQENPQTSYSKRNICQIIPNKIIYLVTSARNYFMSHKIVPMHFKLSPKNIQQRKKRKSHKVFVIYCLTDIKFQLTDFLSEQTTKKKSTALDDYVKEAVHFQRLPTEPKDGNLLDSVCLMNK